MNEILSKSKDVLEIVAIIGVGFYALGLGFSQFRIGKKKQASDQTVENTQTLNLLTNQLNALQALVDRQDKEHKAAVIVYNEQIGKLKGDIGVLQGMIAEKDGKLKEYKEIFQGRNPQLEGFIQSSTDFQKELMGFVTELKEHFVNK